MEHFQLKINELKSWSWLDWKQNLYGDFPDSRRDIPPQNFLESLWLNLTIYLGDFYLLLCFYMFLNTCYFIGGLIFWFIDRFQLLHKYKIQNDKYPENSDYIRCALNLFQNYILIILPLVYSTFPIFRHMGFITCLPLPDLMTFILHFSFCMVVEDITHYWLHRALHWPWLYKNIHKIHHQFTSPFGLAAAYAHPAEVLILGFATFLGALIIRPHFSTFLCWVLYRQLDAVATHSGYDLPNVLNLLPFYGGIATHDYHHKSFIWNYSSRFTFMDILFGTHKKVDNEKEKKPKSTK